MNYCRITWTSLLFYSLTRRMLTWVKALYTVFHLLCVDSPTCIDSLLTWNVLCFILQSFSQLNVRNTSLTHWFFPSFFLAFHSFGIGTVQRCCFNIILLCLVKSKCSFALDLKRSRNLCEKFTKGKLVVKWDGMWFKAWYFFRHFM